MLRVHAANRLDTYHASSIRSLRENSVLLIYSRIAAFPDIKKFRTDSFLASVALGFFDLNGSHDFWAARMFLQFSLYVQSTRSVHQGIVIDIETPIIDQPRWDLRQNKGINLPNPRKSHLEVEQQCMVDSHVRSQFSVLNRSAGDSEICLHPVCLAVPHAPVQHAECVWRRATPVLCIAAYSASFRNNMFWATSL